MTRVSRLAILPVAFVLVAGALVASGPAVAQSPGKSGEGAPAKVAWLELDQGLAEARRTGRPMLVNVYTDWCGWCRKMERTTYADPGIREQVARSFVPVRLNAEDETHRATYRGVQKNYREFADGFRVSSYPTTLFLDREGALITRVPGYVPADRFGQVLRFVGEGHYKTTSWEAYSRGAEPGRR